MWSNRLQNVPNLAWGNDRLVLQANQTILRSRASGRSACCCACIYCEDGRLTMLYDLSHRLLYCLCTLNQAVIGELALQALLHPKLVQAQRIHCLMLPRNVCAFPAGALLDCPAVQSPNAATAPPQPLSCQAPHWSLNPALIQM